MTLAVLVVLSGLQKRNCSSMAFMLPDEQNSSVGYNKGHLWTHPNELTSLAKEVLMSDTT